MRVKRRQVRFAWGPRGGGEIRRVAAIEFAVTAGSGGAGTVWLDELELRPLPPPDTSARPLRAHASSARAGRRPERAVDGDPATSWESAPGDPRPWLLLDLGAEREFGGLVVDWVAGRHARDYRVDVSRDGRGWRPLREVLGSDGGRDPLFLPESEGRYLRLRGRPGAARRAWGIREVTVQPLEWSASLAGFFQAIAREAPPGAYPRGLSGQQVYWTVVGADGDAREALLSEDGMLETGKASFSVEPFLYARGRLVSWSDARTEQRLEQGCLPIPSVRWRCGRLELTVTAFATGSPGSSSVVARYRVRNRDARRLRATLFLALRPFQVNPPSQFLNTPGGVAPIRELAGAGRTARVNRDRVVFSLTPPAGFGAATFDQGDVVEQLRRGRLPARRRVSDPFEHASGAWAYPLDLAPGEEREVDLLVPLHASPDRPPVGPDASAVRRFVEGAQESSRREWAERLSRVTVDLPDSAVARTLKAQLAYVLVNRDGPSIQPGSRSYERSWIRDGALTSSALLRLGHPEAVRDFIEWFAPHQYASGKLPCCVDARGADPVPEHDSSGEFIFLVAEYLRYTGDRGRAEALWPRVARAAAYLDSLRQERRTAEFRAAGKRHFFGLLPPSISHEGYSAKPMHSYWDDLFALRGFKDAAYLAGALGRRAEQARWAAVRDGFGRELGASLAAAMAAHRIDYLPGCADLGDFDATSTTIALDPVQAGALLPPRSLERTFERYWRFFRDRRDGRAEWEAFTPYEMRAIGAFARLGWRERGAELLEFFMRHRRPPGWAQWPEVVRSDARAPAFLGDLPHTWVGSDFVRSTLDLLAYAREADSSLVVGAGVPWGWLAGTSGVTVRDLPTPYGRLGFTLRARGDTVEAEIASGLRVPRGGIVVSARAARPWRRASVNGAPAPVGPGGVVVVRRLPARVLLRP